MHGDEEGMRDVCHEYVSLRHYVFSLVPPHNVRLVDDLDRVQAAIRLVPGEQYLQPAPHV